MNGRVSFPRGRAEVTWSLVSALISSVLWGKLELPITLILRRARVPHDAAIVRFWDFVMLEYAAARSCFSEGAGGGQIFGPPYELSTEAVPEATLPLESNQSVL